MNKEAIIKFFKGNTEITTKQIANYFKQKEPEIKTSVINYRIIKLVENGILQRTGHGKYTIGKTNLYKPVVPDKLKRLYKKLKNKFPLLDFCIWNTSALNEFMIHQPLRYYILIETNREATEAVFNFIKEFNKNVFIEPDEKTIELYIADNNQSIIIKSLTTEAPIQNIDNVPTISIEKLLTDIFCDKYLYAAQQGKELLTIYTEAFNKYTINKSKLLRYAGRRRRKEQIKQYINDNIKI